MRHTNDVSPQTFFVSRNRIGIIMKASVDLPIEFASREHEALMSIWWTSLLLKKVSGKFFQPELASEAQFNILVLLNDSNEEL